MVRPPRRHPEAVKEGAAGTPRPARLFVAEGPERGRSLVLDGSPGKGAATVGRSRACHLLLSDPTARKNPLRLAWEEGAWVLTALGSSKGTRVNGKPAERAVLAPFDRIAVGDT